MKRTATRLISLFLFLSLLIFTGSGPSGAQISSAEEEIFHHILILNSYHQGFEWTDQITSGLLEELGSKTQNLEIYVEYMDAKRKGEEQYLQHLHEILRLKYQDIAFDLIIASDDVALQFLFEHHEEYFSSTPVVFCGINNLDKDELIKHPLFTGFVESLSVKETVNLAFKLHPQAKRLVVITDNSPTGAGQRRNIERELANFFPDLQASYWDGRELTTLQLFEKLRSLPPDSIVLLSVWLRDKTGSYYPYHDLIPLLSTESPAPVYGLLDPFLGYGIVGGKLLGGESQGRAAGRIANRILQGASPSSIPVQAEDANRYKFDYLQLKRWNIPVKKLPKNSLIINLPHTFYDEYKLYIWGGLLLILLQLTVIAGLLSNIQKRKKAEERLEESMERIGETNEELNSTNEELNAAIIEVEHVSMSLQESEKKYRSLFQNMLNGMALHKIVCNSKGEPIDYVFLDVNEAFEKMTGLKKKEILNKRVTEVLPNIINSKFNWIKTYGKVALEGESIRLEEYSESLDRWYTILAYSPQKELFAVIIDDITEEKRAQEILLQSEERMELALSGADLGLWDRNVRTGAVYYNERWARMLGYEPEEIEPHLTTWEQLIHPDDRERTMAILNEHIEKRTPSFEAEFRMRGKNGGWIWILSRGQVTERNTKGEPIRITGTHLDITERKTAEAALRESEKRYRLLFNQSNDAIMMINQNGEILDVNERACEMLNYSCEELLAMPLFDLFPNPAPDLFKENVGRVIAENGAIFEARFKKSNGEIIDINVSAKIVDFEKGILQGIIRDITKQKRDEIRLRHHAKELEVLNRVIQSASKAKDTKELMANVLDAALDLVDFEMGSLYLIDPAQKAARSEHEKNLPPDFLKMVRELDINKEPYRIVFVDKKPIFTTDYSHLFGPPETEILSLGALACVPLLLKDEAIGALAITTLRRHDFSEEEKSILQSIGREAGSAIAKMKLERDIRESEERYRAIVEDQTEIITRWRPNGTVTFVNEACCRFFNKKKEDFLGKGFESYVHEEDRQRVAENIRSLTRARPVAPIENRVILDDGTIRWIRWTNRAVLDEKGAIVEYQSVGLDITEQKEAEREREQLVRNLAAKNQELESIVFVTSHDLRTPLVNLKGFSDEIRMNLNEILALLSQSGFSGKEREAVETILRENTPPMLEFIYSNINKMDSLLRGLLKISRLGLTKMESQQLDMNTLVRNVVRNLHHQIQEKKAVVTVEENLPPCAGDASQIDQVFTNLVDNALKYLSPNRTGEIHIGGHIKNGKIIYFVKDNGVGIPPDHQEKIFQIFQRLDPRGEIAGEGLGLAIVRRIVERHSGRVWVESEPGKGARFFIQLPQEI